MEAAPQPDGKLTARLVFDVTAPWNLEAADGDGTFDNPAGTLQILWFGSASLCQGPVASCVYQASDRTLTYVERRDLTCADGPYDFGSYSIRAQVCNGEGPCPFTLPYPCGREVDAVGASFLVSKEMLGCPVEPTDDCDECRNNRTVGSATIGIGEGVNAPVCASPKNDGPGAQLYYRSGGAGTDGLAGSTAWNATLGRQWSHSYAQRIVEAPDDSHVWLITERATYREFGNLDAGTGLYETLQPSDEYRKLRRNAMADGWTLESPDGTLVSFGSDGRWLSTADRNGNTTSGTYDAQDRLEHVDFPDLRGEDFTYYPMGHASEGKLETITEVGIDGTTSLEWTYTWSGDDLTRIDRPDGTAWVMTYDGAGRLVRLTLEGTDASTRVDSAWEYDADGHVAKLWRGDASFTGPDAVDTWQFAYDDPNDPTQTTVTDPLGQVAVYTYDHDPGSEQTRITSISGDCPSCGLGPNVQIVYDATHTLLPAQVTDGRGYVTTYTYTDDGLVESRTEAMGETEARTTTWVYDATYPGLVHEMHQESVAGSPEERVRILDRDAAGNPEFETIEGFERGLAFSYVTVRGFNGAGQPESVNPPGFYDPMTDTDTDVTTFTYYGDRGDLLVENRFDPLIAPYGMTHYSYDPFNRLTSVTDPNGVETKTEYDELDRVTKIIQVGANSPADDLVTEHVYNVYGDLDHTILPRHNVIDYEYDDAGRLTSIERRPDLLTHGERTVYTLDEAGNRKAESLERWDDTLGDWVVESTTGYLYTTRCHLDQVVHPDGTVTEYAYDCNGNLTDEWDANHPSASHGATTTYGYDPLDRLTTVTRPWPQDPSNPSVTTYGYDVQDHLTSVTDAEGNVTTYTYSDRDLLTQETSPVSGTTTHTYNEHGELVSSTDARMITVTRMVDELDRVTNVDYPDTSLDTTYAYGTDPLTFSLGRLTGITRDGETVDYAWDRFGRVTQDGELTFAYDDNGNRTDIGYPGDVSATYTFDYADREQTLTVTRHVGTMEETSTSVVTDASYYPSGPLSTLALGNGVTETRTFTTRYFPDTISLDAPRVRSWTYSTDAVGNVTGIVSAGICDGDVSLTDVTVDDTQPFTSCAALEAGPSFTVTDTGTATLTAATRVVLNNGFSVADGGRLVAGTDPTLSGNTTKTYGYHDSEYFLTSADGPWGSFDWTYDRIGNRTSETNYLGTDIYSYDKNGPSGTGGNTALLRTITPALGGSRGFAYTPAGHQTQVNNNGNLVTFNYDAAGRLFEANRAGAATCPFVYDGRGYLRQAGDLATTGTVVPTYDSAGLLHSLLKQPSATDPQRRYHVFYLAGRPVAQLASESSQPDRWWYLTTDHLGTPLLATDTGGAELWENRFEPFGGDPAGQALEAEIFLRFPGQWDDGTWADATLGAGVVYNVNRWYQPSFSRYSRADPLGLEGGASLFVFGLSNPVANADPLGLLVLAPGQKCKGFDTALNRLKRLTMNCACVGFFRDSLGVDLDMLINGPLPQVEIGLPVNRTGRGGQTRCGSAPQKIEVTKDYCGLFGSKRDLTRALLHELGHWADCKRQKFPLGGPFDEGALAEIWCFGATIDNDPVSRLMEGAINRARTP